MQAAREYAQTYGTTIYENGQAKNVHLEERYDILQYSSNDCFQSFLNIDDGKSNVKLSTVLVVDEANAGGGEGWNPWKAALASSAILVGDDATVVGAIDDIAIPVILAGAATYDVTQRVYLTYTLKNKVTGQTYVGRTSGFGDPYSIMMARYAGHHMALLGYGSPTLDVAVQGLQGYPAIRGREQQLIDFYGGVGSPAVGNSIRGVSYYNPLGRGYDAASNMYFGPLAPYTGF